MSPKAKKFSDLAAPLHADPTRRARIETEKRAILAGMRLAELRAEYGLTQVQLAQHLGTTQEYVLSNRARRGHATVNHQALRRSSRRQPRAARRVRDRDVPIAMHNPGRKSAARRASSSAPPLVAHRNIAPPAGLLTPGAQRACWLLRRAMRQ